ncbi:hypothetical protein [Atlantibacter subterraneus]|uniref:Uncharacterized protein n=1 Tax=Atlantibacter subterraneus TaxID=255519 RepID=A0ABU4E1C6_9ENTR|nr:hypothetical protein [Atlantibacter subterranea]MDV7022917.1 hypothetical protein [Atlantibacter subterranea]MDW2741715.1 hypothetical protein [Atlantibacter subterranea]MDZ5666640.1 hypothetical protein [Atlantibacter hermannii]UTJ48663.1 hypothetical protein NLZ15_06445 [Atlantibacter subterranea]
MNQDEQVRPEDIHQAIGEASNYLMEHCFALTAGNLSKVLLAQDILSTDLRQKTVLSLARQFLKQKMHGEN